MSYFTNKNNVEVGPGPSQDIEWLIVENYDSKLHKTRCVVVSAKNGYTALNKAERLIQDLNKNVCKLYQSPVIFKEK